MLSFFVLGERKRVIRIQRLDLYRVFSLGWSNHHDLPRERSQRRRIIVLRSPVHLEDTTLAYNSLRFTLHEALERSVVESAGLFTVTLGWKNTSSKRTRSAPTVMELVGFHLVVFRDVSTVLESTPKFLCDIPSNLTHCGDGERVPLPSGVLNRILSKIAVSQTDVRNALNGVHHAARRSSPSVQDSKGRHVKWRES